MKTNKSEFIKIGALYGGAFMYAGDVKDIDSKLQKIDERYLRNYQMIIRRHEEQVKRFNHENVVKREAKRLAPGLGKLNRKKKCKVSLEEYINLRLQYELESVEKWEYRLDNVLTFSYFFDIIYV
jgi:hypothetical protein